MLNLINYCGLAAVIEKDLWATRIVNEEYLEALNAHLATSHV